MLKALEEYIVKTFSTTNIVVSEDDALVIEFEEGEYRYKLIASLNGMGIGVDNVSPESERRVGEISEALLSIIMRDGATVH